MCFSSENPQLFYSICQADLQFDYPDYIFKKKKAKPGNLITICTLRECHKIDTLNFRNIQEFVVIFIEIVFRMYSDVFIDKC